MRRMLSLGSAVLLLWTRAVVAAAQAPPPDNLDVDPRDLAAAPEQYRDTLVRLYGEVLTIEPLPTGGAVLQLFAEVPGRPEVREVVAAVTADTSASTRGHLVPHDCYVLAGIPSGTLTAARALGGQAVTVALLTGATWGNLTEADGRLPPHGCATPPGPD